MLHDASNIRYYLVAINSLISYNSTSGFTDIIFISTTNEDTSVIQAWVRDHMIK